MISSSECHERDHLENIKREELIMIDEMENDDRTIEGKSQMKSGGTLGPSTPIKLTSAEPSQISRER